MTVPALCSPTLSSLTIPGLLIVLTHQTGGAICGRRGRLLWGSACICRFQARRCRILFSSTSCKVHHHDRGLIHRQNLLCHLFFCALNKECIVTRYSLECCHSPFLLIKSRISLNRMTSSEGAAGAGAGAASSFFRRKLLINRITVKITRAISRKLTML